MPLSAPPYLTGGGTSVVALASVTVAGASVAWKLCASNHDGHTERTTIARYELRRIRFITISIEDVGRLIDKRSDSIHSQLRFCRCGELGLVLLHSLHQLGMARPLDTLFLCRSVEFRMEVVAALAGILLFFNGNTMRIGPRILTNAGHLPGDFQAGAAARDPEGAILDFPRDVDRSEST